MRKRSTQGVRRRNRFDVLQSTYAGGRSVSRQEIAADTGLSTATVATLIGELLESGVLVTVGQEDSGGGRPRGRLAVNSDRGVLIGVDVAETRVHFELFDVAMKVLRTVDRNLTPHGYGPDEIVIALVTGIRDLLGGSDAQTLSVIGIGIAVPGLVEREGGVSVFSPYWAWHDVPLKAMLSRELKYPIYLDNPLKASVLAELWFGAGRELDNVIVATLRTGVGVGIAIDGALFRGSTDSAGEWGHTSLVLDGRPCPCGNLGCVEAYVGAPGIMMTARELAPEQGMDWGDDPFEAIAGIGAAAEQGDPTALKVIEQTGRYLGAAVANLVNLFNPQILVLGDWVPAKLGAALLEATCRYAGQYSLAEPFRAVRIIMPASTNNSIALGAATLALEGFLSDLGRT